jgi:hypothetical protein
MSYRRVHLLLEGQTEETVTARLFRPFLETNGWAVTSSVMLTARPANGPAHRGGVSTWPKLQREIKRLLRDTNITVLTTVLDYYGFPSDSPGMGDRPDGGAEIRVAHVEHALSAAIGDSRFVPHLSLHETEAWVFAAPSQFADQMGVPGLREKLLKVAAAAGGPELVNDGPSTAPSKRLLAYCPGYTKTLDGPRAVADLGVAALREQCPHLDGWLAKFETPPEG